MINVPSLHFKLKLNCAWTLGGLIPSLEGFHVSILLLPGGSQGINVPADLYSKIVSIEPDRIVDVLGVLRDSWFLLQFYEVSPDTPLDEFK